MTAPEPGEWPIPTFANLIASARGFAADHYPSDGQSTALNSGAQIIVALLDRLRLAEAVISGYVGGTVFEAEYAAWRAVAHPEPKP